MSSLTIETLANGTIPQIKEWAKSNNFKYPYKLKKAEAIIYLQTEYNKKTGFNNDTAVSTINSSSSSSFSPSGTETGSNSTFTIDTLNKGTVEDIKKWAKENNIDFPSGLKKEHLIDYIRGSKIEKEKGINKQMINSNMKLEDLHPVSADASIDWFNHLHKFGWAVAPIPGWKPDFVNMFFDFLESCNPVFKRNEIDTWKGKNLPTLLHGILKHYFGHTELEWQIRELCAPIFARIFNCSPSDLLSSFDGGCFMNVKKKNTNKSWIHVDQSRYTKGFLCVQGVVNFIDNGAEDGGLVLVENSRSVFEEYMNKYPSEGITWGPANMEDSILKDKKLLKICAPAGHVLLWDSRMFHCNVQPTGSALKEDGTPRFRMATYVSMQPRLNATEKELKKRVELYEKGRMTGHWCYGHYFSANAEHPYTRGGPNNRPDEIEIAKLNDLRKRLIGYS